MKVLQLIWAWRMGRELHLQCDAWGSLPHRSTKFCCPDGLVFSYIVQHHYVCKLDCGIELCVRCKVAQRAKSLPNMAS